MSLTKKEFSNYIKQFQFREMFNEMGWNNDKTVQPIVIDDSTYSVKSVGEKSGFKILICDPLVDGLIPDYSTRRKIETKVTKLFQEHLIIFSDSSKTEQIWQLVVRQTGKPSKITETRYHISQDPELLFQRAAGIFFNLDEEENITIIDVTQRISDNFHQNNEKVTKQFYDKFKKEHTSFLNFIEGIDDNMNKDWYASLMLNRLMFCYFIQKKGFLDNDKDYLRKRLKACQAKKGKDKFYSFYRNFLLSLFHQGLGAPNHADELKKEIGRIPYLNGGLFDEHELEINYNTIAIDDKAFEKLFDFFDQYEWHLDTNVTASGKDINPDVIGYIFEKYINDRANMGAYYTKEDITDYISKNCILPFLFDEIKRNHPKAFEANGEIWSLVKNNANDYIYDAVKKGTELELPEDIAIGITQIDKRTEWNKPAPISHALPTEIWREVVDRRNRYTEIKSKVDNGEITDINDFITYNLNIRQFVQDVVEQTTDAEFLKHFYKALNSVTIIDPTCGSGAFLFAAMNILEPLYESCIQRMENFVAEASKGKYKFFEETIGNVKSPEHPNLQYFIYKSIILRNLYGVDIMKEAVEIAKLRLFLKLVATVEADYRKPNLGLEPLPDVDFNIRAGNTLVGFATELELKKGLDYTFDGPEAKPIIEEKCDIVAKAFTRYKDIQLSYGDNFEDFKKAKTEVNKRLQELNHELNQLLHKQAQAIPYDKWLKTHQPFHWFAEYYEIIHDKGGFDVIIGNPPYVVYTKKDSKTKISVQDNYKLQNFETLKSNNLYSFCIERSYSITNQNSRIGMIIPISSVSSNNFSSVQNIFANKLLTWQSNFSNRPGKLFEDVEQRLTIFVSQKIKNNSNSYYSSSFKHWYASTRNILFPSLIYVENKLTKQEISFSKVGSALEIELKDKLMKKANKTLGKFVALQSKYFTYYHNGPTYFIRAMSFMPNDGPKMKPSSHYKKLIYNQDILNIPTCVLNSSLFYYYYKNYSNCRDFSEREINSFPLGDISEDVLKKISALEIQLKKSYKNNQELKNRVYESGLIYYEEFYPAKSKSIIDEIDTLLAQHYGFSAEELDFIINYDIKYRMGKELDNEED